MNMQISDEDFKKAQHLAKTILEDVFKPADANNGTIYYAMAMVMGYQLIQLSGKVQDAIIMMFVREVMSITDQMQAIGAADEPTR